MNIMKNDLKSDWGLPLYQY